MQIKRIVKINNAYLYGMYLLCKEEYENQKSCEPKCTSFLTEETLYHATSPKIANIIAHDNIDWRKTERSRYGIGACFSPSPFYAHLHANVVGGIVFILSTNVD